RELDPCPSQATDVQVSPDGSLAAVACGPVGPGGKWSDTGVLIYDLATGKVLRRFDKHTNLVRGVHFSDDGRQAFSVDLGKTLRLWTVADAAEVKATPLPFSVAGRPVPSRDGRHVLVPCLPRLSWLDVETGKEVSGIAGERFAFFNAATLTGNDRFIL